MGRTLHTSLVACITVVASCMINGIAAAGDCACEQCGSACQHSELVECTVYVPITVVETRMRTRVIKNMEQREQKYTAFKRVPVTRTVTKERCYMEDVIRTKEITKKQCHIVKNPIVRSVHVHRYVPEIREHTTLREMCTACGKVCVEETCQCMVMRKTPDVVAENCEEFDVVFTECKQEISYCSKEPKREEIPCFEETVYELQPVEQTRIVEVCVPEIIKEPYEVCYKKMVPKKILCCRSCCTKHR